MIAGTVYAEGEAPIEIPEDAAVEIVSGNEGVEEINADDPLPEQFFSDEQIPEEEPSEGSSAEDDESMGADESAGDDEANSVIEDETETNDENSQEDAATAGEFPLEEHDELATEGEDTVVEPIIEDEIPQIEIVDSEGELLDSASQESAELSNGGDPYWKVGTRYYSVAPSAGQCYGNTYAEGTCWTDIPAGMSPIQYALNKIESENLLPSDRKLYVLAGTYTGNISISGGYLGQMNGLIGVDGSEEITIVGDVSLDHMSGGFTLSGFTITGGVEITNSIGNVVLQDLDVSNPDGDGIKVASDWPDGEGYIVDGPQISGTITLNEVNSHHNQGIGAILWALNTIKVTNSSFNYNDGTEYDGTWIGGLYVNTQRANKITDLNGVVAKGNTGSGLYILPGSATVRNVIAEDNINGYGLYLYSGWNGTYKLENIIADNNGDRGIEVHAANAAINAKNIQASGNNDYGFYVYTYGAVTINTCTTNHNALDGLYIQAGKNVVLSSINSSFNGLDGLHVKAMEIHVYDPVLEEWVLSSYLGPTSVTLTSPKSGGLVMANYFEDNGRDGIHIESKGAITISNADSFGNTGSGYRLDNCLLNERTGLCMGTGNVTINTTVPIWTNAIYDNEDTGIVVDTKGNLSISKTQSQNNSGSGLMAFSWGTITLNQFVAAGNEYYGAYLDNTRMAGRAVTLTDSLFYGNNYLGLSVKSLGAITLNGVNATENHSPSWGYLGNIPISVIDRVNPDETEIWSVSGKGEEVNITLFGDGFNVTLELRDADGYLIQKAEGGSQAQITYTLEDGVDYELWVLGNDSGGVCGYHLTLNDEDFQNVFLPGSGAVLDNSGAKANVTINGTKNNPYNNFYANENFGLRVISFGNITLNNTSAYNNYHTGLSLDNPASTGIVTISDRTTTPQSVNYGNGWEGVYVRTKGNILLTGISTFGNGWGGVNLDNCLYDGDSGLCTGSGLVTLVNTTAWSNYDTGISIVTKGNLSLTNVNASQNQGFGIYLDNKYALGNVTLKNVTAESNNDTGILIYTNGLVNLSAINTNHNVKTQGFINLSDAVSEFYNADAGEDYWYFNAQSGTIYNFYLSASDNPDWDVNNFAGVLELFDEEGNPVDFSSVSGMGTGSVIASWTADADGRYYLKVSDQNENNGFYRLSMNNPTFENQTYFFVNGLSIIGGKNVTFTGTNYSNANYNSLAGLWVETPANISLLNFEAHSNGTEGAVLDNYMEGSGIGNVIVAGQSDEFRSAFSANGWEGLVIRSNGTISLGNIKGSSNGASGIVVNNSQALTAKTVTINNVDLYFNGGDGLSVETLGNITIRNTNAQGNGNHGVSLNNSNGLGGVLISGENYLSNNGMCGLSVDTNGAVNITGIDARMNGESGVYIIGRTGLITLTNIFVMDSYSHGIDINTEGAVTLNNVISFRNGRETDGDGLHIITEPTRLVSIRGSAFMGNGGQGVELGYRGENWIKPVILTSVIFGNDSDGSGEANLVIENVSP